MKRVPLRVFLSTVAFWVLSCTLLFIEEWRGGLPAGVLDYVMEPASFLRSLAATVIHPISTPNWESTHGEFYWLLLLAMAVVTATFSAIMSVLWIQLAWLVNAFPLWLRPLRVRKWRSIHLGDVFIATSRVLLTCILTSIVVMFTTSVIENSSNKERVWEYMIIHYCGCIQEQPEFAARMLVAANEINTQMSIETARFIKEHRLREGDLWAELDLGVNGDYTMREGASGRNLRVIRLRSAYGARLAKCMKLHAQIMDEAHEAYFAKNEEGMMTEDAP